MLETIVGAVISLVTWLVDKNQKAKLKVQHYLGYIESWLKNTKDATEIADEHDDLFNRNPDDKDVQ